MAEREEAGRLNQPTPQENTQKPAPALRASCACAIMDSIETEDRMPHGNYDRQAEEDRRRTG
jgi:hypothetical protein